MTLLDGTKAHVEEESAIPHDGIAPLRLMTTSITWLLTTHHGNSNRVSRKAQEIILDSNTL